MKVRPNEVRWWVLLYLRLRRRESFTISGTRVEIAHNDGREDA